MPSSNGGTGTGLLRAQAVAKKWKRTMHLGWSEVGVESRFEAWLSVEEPRRRTR